MIQKRDITCFKSYDVRGKVPDELNEEIAYHIGIAYAKFLMPQKVVVGYTKNCLEIAKTLYDQIVVKTVPVSSTKVAEATKRYLSTRMNLHMCRNQRFTDLKIPAKSLWRL